ncbi:ubiquitin 3 binding protein But2 C-terminal domain-containing protein [Xylariomycetidae sp. FL2044]|nr:ubiquitin 3 binding protein But2 C-terminal domain-containing protein [Xylariomycetidae sp. FL2044]
MNGSSVSAPVGQYGSGQTRAGSSDTPSTFSLSGDNGTLTDAQGRGCWWTPPATVLQCDVGQTPEPGFSVGCDGVVSFGGQSTFYECATGVGDIIMIYREPNGSNCDQITLSADGCRPESCAQVGTTTAPTETVTAPAGTVVGPGETVTAPGETVTAPGETVTAPGETVTVPGAPGETVTVTAPGETVTGPGETVTVSGSPGETVTVSGSPGETVTIPGSPGETVTAPAVTVTVTESAAPVTITAPAITVTAPCESAGSATVPGPSVGQNTTVYVTVSSDCPVLPTTPGGGGAGTVPGTVGETATAPAPAPAQSTTTPGAGGASSPQPTYSQASSPGGGGVPGQSTAPLTGAWEYPHLIIPISSAEPTRSFGTSYNGVANSTVSTIFQFDIPSSDTGKTCTAVFYLPLLSSLETSSYNLTTTGGSGSLQFSRLQAGEGVGGVGEVNETTTYADAQAAGVLETYGILKEVRPGNAYTIAEFACPAGGGSVALEMSSVPQQGSGTDLEFFQDYNPCPLGVYVLAS